MYYSYYIMFICSGGRDALRHRDSVDLLIGVLGGAAVCACCLVLCLDLFSSSTRTPSQRACLKWSNICSLFYSILERESESLTIKA